MMSSSNPGERTRLSVVIPVLNEEGSLPELWQSLLRSLPPRSEVIFVDDGSSDGSRVLLEGFARSDARARLVCLRRNFGKTPALAAGFFIAQGTWVAVLDADLQNDPADIPLLLAKAEEGYDVVSGWRRNRVDPLLTKVLPSRVANWLVSKATGLPLHDYGCALKVFNREILESITLQGDMHRLLPAYLYKIGAKVTEVEIRHCERRLGVSHYGWERVPKVLLDLVFFSFLRIPAAHPFLLVRGGAIGLLVASLGVVAVAIRRRPPGGSFMMDMTTWAGVGLGAIGAALLTLAVLAQRPVRSRLQTVEMLQNAIEETINCQKPSSGQR